MSDSNRSGSVSVSGSNTSSESSSEEDYGVVCLGAAAAPYQDEPLARPREGGAAVHRRDDGEDKDGLSRQTLADRYEGRSGVEEWCTCGCCHVECLNGALEHRCCREVNEAFGKVVFEGLSDVINCITLFNDYKSMTSNVVLTQVGPVLKGKDGRHYRQRAGQSKNGYMRAVGYRWVARYLFGYMGWDNTRPLPACIYHHLRTKYPTHESKGYLSAQDRA